MNVLIIDSGQKFGQGGGWFDTEKCVNGFRAIGMSVSCLGRDDADAISTLNFRDLVELHHPDFVFAPMAQANYGFLSQIVNGDFSVPLVFWNGTDDQDFSFTSQISSRVALYCCASSRFVERHRDLGANSIFLPFAADPQIFYPDKVYLDYQSDLCYVGVPFGNKVELLTPLENEYKCCFKFGSMLLQKEVGKVYNSAKIALSPATHQDIVAPGEAGCTWNTFEVSATRAFLLQRDRPDLHLLFRDDELATFDGTFRDFKKKIDYYLGHEEERREIAEKAYRRVISEHLVKHRFGRVLERMGERV